MGWSIDKYAAAWDFATRRHMGQTYGGSRDGEQIPYINHLASVAAEVLWGIGGAQHWDVDFALQCALLHDVIEDTETSCDIMTSKFGADVTAGVAALTLDKSLPSRMAQMDDCLRRIQLQPQEIWVVKMADRITNLYHPPFYWTQHKIEQYQIESQLILGLLGPANTEMADRLAKKIRDYRKAA